MLGKKWLYLLREQKKLVQQYDPFDGTPCVTRSEGLSPAGEESERYEGITTLGPEGYGPTILAALEYISLLCGVNISFEKITWSAVLDWPSGTYTQFMYGHAYSLSQDGRVYAGRYRRTSCFLLFLRSTGDHRPGRKHTFLIGYRRNRDSCHSAGRKQPLRRPYLS